VHVVCKASAENFGSCESSPGDEDGKQTCKASLISPFPSSRLMRESASKSEPEYAAQS